MGTPKTLGQAFTNALEQYRIDGLSEKKASLHIKDFMAQKFCIALCKAQDKTERDCLNNLFKELTKEQE